MADVAGAFKILISADVSTLAGAFSTATSLISGAASAASAAVGSFVSLGSSIKDLSASFAGFISEGGDFNEQVQQFGIYAGSFGQSGKDIVGVFKDISQGTITAADAMKLGTKALSAGIVGKDLETILTYAKKFSESFGGSFEEAAEKAIKGFANGTPKLLKEIGIFVKTGDTYEAGLAQMSEKTARFADTGVNLGDVFKAVSVGFEEFRLGIAGAIASSPTLIKMIQTISGVFSMFTNSLQTEGGGAITAFFDVLFQAVDTVIPNIEPVLDFVWNLWTSVLKNGGEVAKNMLFSATQIFYDTFNTIMSYAVPFINGLIDVISTIGAAFTGIPMMITSVFNTVFSFVAGIFQKLGNLVFDHFEMMFSGVTSLVRVFPKLSGMMGLDNFSRDMNAVVSEQKNAFNGMIDGATAFTQTLADGFEESDNAREAFFNGLKVSAPDITAQMGKARAAILGIVPDEGRKAGSWTKTAGQDHIKAFGKEKDLMKLAEKEAEKANKAELRATEKAERERKRAQDKAERDQISADKKAVKEAEKNSKAITKAMGKPAMEGVIDLGKELSDAYDDLAKLAASPASFENWEAEAVRREQIKTLADSMAEQARLQNRTITAAEASVEAQKMLAESIANMQAHGVSHVVSVENFSEFMNKFLVEVFKKAGILARAEAVKVVGG